MAKARCRRMMSFTISDRTRALLRSAPNRSQYVDRVLRAYPPPQIKSVADVQQLIRERHPYAVDPETGRVYDGLPTFGGERPSDGPSGRPVSWSYTLVCSDKGIIRGRDHWEREALLATIECAHKP